MIRTATTAIALLALAALLACEPASSPPGAIPPPEASAASAPTGSRAPVTTATPRPTATPTPGPTSTAAPASRDGTYLALGDSLAVGVGASQPSRLGYVALLFERLRAPDRAGGPSATRLANVAVSGETSSSLIAGGQLERALQVIADSEPRVSVVTLDIGGNDLLRLLGTEPCTSAPASDGCEALVRATLDGFEANERRVLAELRRALDAAASPAPLAVMTYFNPFSGTDDLYEVAADRALLGADGRVDCAAARRDVAARGMNDIIACLGEEHGAIVVDVQPLYAGLGLELTHIGSEDIHSNDAGYAVIADAFAEALSR